MVHLVHTMYNVHRVQKEDNNECISFKDARSTAGDFLDLKIVLEPLESTVFSYFFEERVRGPLNVLNDSKLKTNDQGGSVSQTREFLTHLT